MSVYLKTYVSLITMIITYNLGDEVSIAFYMVMIYCELRDLSVVIRALLDLISLIFNYYIAKGRV